MIGREINFYFASFLITLVGAGASLIIVNVANHTNFETKFTIAGYEW
jgi:hypothetical protein